MSKMYEALQAVAQESGKERNPATVQPPSSRFANGLDLEREMRNLYRALDGMFPSFEHKVILFLGTNEGEGTSTIVSGLAKAAAQEFGRKVAILDADTLNPTQHQLNGVIPVNRSADMPEDNGLNDLGLCIVSLSAGRNSPGRIVVDSETEATVERLRRQFDLVLIDAPPVTSTSESIILSRQTDGVVLVIQAERTRWPSAKIVCERISATGGKVLGTVLNKRRFYIPEMFYKRL